MLSIISIHAPRAGCDRAGCAPLTVAHLISIHAPRAGCDSVINQHVMVIDISIHAPRAGCDEYDQQRNVTIRISIHAPRAGCDILGSGHPSSWRYFNPRTPCGVRPVRCPAQRMRHTISIHAPRAGCDMPVRSTSANANAISIHAPRAGCDDVWPIRAALSRSISIHAPRAGCDERRSVSPRRSGNFNPRTPCGVRRSNLL